MVYRDNVHAMFLVASKRGWPRESNQKGSGCSGWKDMQSMRCGTEGEKDEVEEDSLSSASLPRQEIVDMWF